MRFFLRIILPLVIIAFGVYLVWIYFTPTSPDVLRGDRGPDQSVGVANQNEPPFANTMTDRPPIIETAGVTRIFDGRIVAFWWYGRDERPYAIKDDGAIIDGSGTVLSSQTLNGLRFALPSPAGDRVAVSFGGRAAPVFSLFSLATKTWRPMPQGTFAAAWSPAGDRLALLIDKGETTQLSTWDPATDKTQTLLSLAAVGFLLNWPEPDIILLSEPPSRESASSLWSYSIKNRALAPVFKNETGPLFKWIQDKGLKLYGQAFSLINPAGATLKTFSFRTLPGKCAWNATKMFCAIPRDFDRRVIPDDYLKQKNTSSDDIYEVGADGTLGEKVYESNPLGIQVDIQMPTLRGDALYFIDRYSGMLYAWSIN